MDKRLILAAVVLAISVGAAAALMLPMQSPPEATPTESASPEEPAPRERSAPESREDLSAAETPTEPHEPASMNAEQGAERIRPIRRVHLEDDLRDPWRVRTQHRDRHGDRGGEPTATSMSVSTSGRRVIDPWEEAESATQHERPERRQNASPMFIEGSELLEVYED